MRHDVDALIVGAGPAGASAAILLARAGWSVALVEKQRFPRRKVCGECIAASNLPLVAALGLGEAFAARAGPELRRVALMRGERVLVAPLPAAVGAAPRWGRALGRETLDTLLVDQARAAGVRVLQPCAVRSIDGVPGDWRIALRPLDDADADIDADADVAAEAAADAGADAHPDADANPHADADAGPRTAAVGSAGARRAARVDSERQSRAEPLNEPLGPARANDARSMSPRPPDVLHAAVAIAANGSWEALPSGRPARRAARQASDLFAFKANFRGTALEPGLLPVLSFDGGYGGMVVADDALTTLACCVRRDRLDAARRAAPGARAGDVVEALLATQCRGVREALRGARRDGPWLAAGPIDPGVHLAPVDAPFRIGNAAGEAHPIIGEGISMALQSAWLLCGRLVARQGPSGVPDAAAQRAAALAFANDWRHAFAPRLRVAALFAHAALHPASAGALERLVATWPGLLTTGARWGGKTRCAPDATTIRRLAPGALAAHAPSPTATRPDSAAT